MASNRAVTSALSRWSMKALFNGLATGAALHPRARPHAHNLSVRRNVAYRKGAGRAHRLDIYRRRDLAGPLPVLFYIHGGAFSILSKDTHWIFALMFARAGFLVVTINYRLAPTHPFPAAIEDCADALCWLHEHLASLGGDPSRLILAGESAGANLATALTLMTTYERPDATSRRVHATGLVPRVLLPMCGILQVSDPGRFDRRRPDASAFFRARVHDIARRYLGATPEGPARDLADPLRVVERALQPQRPWPATLATVGTRDLLLDDSRRLAQAVRKLGAVGEFRAYDKQVHAFQAFVWMDQARQCWRDTFDFLASHASAPAPS